MTDLAAYIVFAATYVVVALGYLPGFRIDRAGAALSGGALMVAFGVLDLEQAFHSIDYATIALLLGMMIVVTNLELCGFFRLAGNWVVRRTHTPLGLLGAIIASSGILSAFFVNDTVCLMLTPLVCEIVVRLKRNPLPYLLALATASNIGSMATITGNPQNMMIGSFSRLSFVAFAAPLAPVSAAGLVVAFVWIAFLYRDEFAGGTRFEVAPAAPYRVLRPLLWKSIAASVFMLAMFLAGQPPPRPRCWQPPSC